MKYVGLVALLGLILSFGCAKGGGSGDRPDARGNDLPDGAAGTPDASDQTACTLVPQTGCQPNQACDLDANDNPTCRAVSTPGTETNACANPTECAARYVCAGFDVNYTSCLEYCTSDGDCTPPGGRCAISLGSVTVCSQNCDPLTAGGCPQGWGCLIGNNGSFDYTACVFPGAGGQNAACATYADCRAGFMCASVNNGPTACYRMCSDLNDTCGVLSLTCNINFTPPILIGSTTYGICV